jgi:hypothetical protein
MLLLKQPFLLHVYEFYDFFTTRKANLLHIHHSHVHLCDLASQNQEIRAKKKSGSVVSNLNCGYPAGGDVALGFQGTRSILGEIFLLAETKSQQLLATICVVNLQKSTYKVHF